MNQTANYKCKSQNLSWIDVSDEQAEKKIQAAVQRNAYQNWTEADVRAALLRGELVKCSDYWWDEIAFIPARREYLAAKKAGRPAPPPVTMCDCGHATYRPMRASLGTACPDCYDRMSN